MHQAIRVEVEHRAVICFAMEQVGMPIVTRVEVSHGRPEALENTTLLLSLEPGLGEVRLALPRLDPGHLHVIGPIDLSLAPGHLRAVTEAERVVLVHRVLEGDEELLRGEHPVELLAFNEWPGERCPPLLLATFVLPNHPVVVEVLRRLRTRLEAETGDGTIAGYQRGLERTRAEVGALYRTLQDFGLSYIGVPASFETSGQKVRLPDMVLQGQMGNCLDLTVFFAACAEQMGLAPLLVMVEGHALPAVWLLDDRFPEGVVGDAARLRTAIELGHLLAVDSGTLVGASAPPLEKAVEVAGAILAAESCFRHAIDVRVARRDGFRPLPVRITVEVEASTVGTAETPVSQQVLLDAEAVVEAPEATPAAPEPVAARFKAWRDRLLDLSLRNRLLNLRESAQTLRLEVADLARFEDQLAQDRSFEVHPRPAISVLDQRDAALVAARLDPERLRADLAADLERGIVRVPLEPDLLFRRAIEIERAARGDLEEGGAHTLYVALGLLRWFDKTGDTQAPRLAPLILVPVVLGFDRRARRLRLQRAPDQEIIGNTTLVEKLRRDFAVDFAFLDALEPDEAGVDVPSALRQARLAIQQQPRWSIVEEALLGLFTFSKFLMWRDLTENTQVLLESPAVQHIAEGGRTAFPDPVGEPAVAGLDAEAPPLLPVVLDADGTQTAAVLAAVRGRSFVLQGPPGTGKSQTITNLIAATLAEGRTVLFVSEKMAALEVVQRRLSQVGLGDFCLELHSNKASKKAVLEALGAAWHRPRTTAVGRDPGPELAAARAHLNAYAEAAHRPRALGLSFYEATARLHGLGGPPGLKVVVPRAAEVSEAQYRQWTAEVAAFATAAAVSDPVASHPLAEVRAQRWSSEVQDAAEEALAAARRSLAAAEEKGEFLKKTIGLADLPLEGLRPLAEQVAAAEAGPIPVAALEDTAWPALATRARAALAARQAAEAARRDLDQRWQPDLLTLDRADLLRRFARWTGFFLAFLFLWGARKRLRGLARGALPQNDRILADLRTADTLAAEAPGQEAEWNQVVAALGGAADVSDLAALIDRGDAARAWRRAPIPGLAAALSGADHARLGRLGAELRAALVAADADLDRVNAALQTSLVLAGPLAATLACIEGGLGRLRDWCHFQQCKAVVEGGPAVSLLEAHAAGQVTDLPTTFERAFLTRWTNAVRDAEPALLDFRRAEHERRIADFRALDAEHLQASRRQVVARLEARLPDPNLPAAEASEPGILLREMRKKSRHLPLRRLFQQIPALLPRLKPCLLMSPLSVAQYLPAHGRRFDLVVFDEASQICTHDAIGAIGRGKQVVIVGDSKQLPPTAFFTRTSNENDTPDENDVVELESVLDEALAARFPEQMLGWHYRSRHEALIDFSNDRYYQGRLNVFPAAHSRVDHLGVHWHPIEGVYDRGNTRTNRAEAEALVKWLVDALQTRGGRTYGVVTFSMAQQGLVNQLLDEARTRHPEIEPHFATDQPEYVFVKNLENVQGDERDVMLFSICYGPDAEGRVSLGFGPLNTPGGERRLNVAVTRARQALHVFSTLRAEHIDRRRTVALGAHHLRDFLEYAAARGGTAIQTERTPGNAFEADGRALVRALGHDADLRVGCGARRIDIAVRHPERAGEYVLGIELDGPEPDTTARDRERLRPLVLGGLGWRLHRLWSAELMEDRDGARTRIEATITQALSAQPAVPTPIAASVVNTAPAKTTPEARPQYRYATLRPLKGGLDAFLSAAATPQIQSRIRQTIEAEAPLHHDELTRRIAACWDLDRITPRIRDRVLENLPPEVHRAGDFLWPNATTPTTWTTARRPAPGEPAREAELIPPEEIAAAVMEVLKHALSLPHDALMRETAKLFGITRLGRKVEEVMGAGIEEALRRGLIRQDGERYRG